MYYELLAKIRNAQLARKQVVRAPYAAMDFEVAKILVAAGYAEDAREKAIHGKSSLEITLFSREEKPQGISGFKIISKPGRRIYVGYRGLRLVRQGYGIGVLSTSKGIMTIHNARKQKIGGEYLFELW